MNEKEEILLVYNPTHKILLPPCKTMYTNEMPHQAVERIMKQQVGLERNEYEIDKRFHGTRQKLYRVLDCEAPFAAQQEFITKQSKQVRYHYSLIYVYKIVKGVQIKVDTEYFPKFYNLSDLRLMEDKIKPFQDIIQRYEKMLDVIEQKRKYEDVARKDKS